MHRKGLAQWLRRVCWTRGVSDYKTSPLNDCWRWCAIQSECRTN